MWTRIFVWTAVSAVVLAAIYELAFFNRIYPTIKIAGVNVSGKTKSSAQAALSTIQPPQPTLVSQDPKVELQLTNLQIEYNPQQSVENAYSVGRTGGLINRLNQRVSALTQKPNLLLSFSLNQEALESYLDNLSEQINVPATEPTLAIDNGQVVVNKGRDGRELDRDLLGKAITVNLAYALSDTITIPVKVTKSHLEDAEIEIIKHRAQNLVGKSLRLSVEFQSFSYSASELLPTLSPDGFKDEHVNLLVGDIANSVNRPPQDARLVFENGRVRTPDGNLAAGAVKEFAPGRDGLETNKEELKNQVKASIENLIVTDKKAATIEIPVTRTKPQVATGDVNNLGIKELVGRGTSIFRGSIPGRIHNVALAASRINGLLIKPGEIFSFNSALGDVSAYTGYQQAYVIKDGKTILGDGGGVCQVSTTLFRSALNAGLPIIERKAHAYRVHYYEEDSRPGIDATVYDPTADLKIKNDTQNNILIQTRTDSRNLSLVIELYGTGDGRVAQILNHRIWDIEPAPPPLYQDDPSLAPGQTKQVDFAAPGTKAAFDYKVIRNDEVLQNRTFYSNYRPWQAVFLRGPETGQP